MISLNGFPLVSLQAPYTLWRLGFVFPRGRGCSQMHEPSLSSAVQHVLHRYSPVCLGSQCGLVPWGGCSLSQQKGEALCLGYVKGTGLQLSLPEIFDWATSLTEISPMAPAV